MFDIKINTLEQEFDRVKNTIEYIPFFLENYGVIKGNLPKKMPKSEDGSEPGFLIEMKEKILSEIVEKSPGKKIGIGRLTEIERENYLKEFEKYYYPDILKKFKYNIEKDIAFYTLDSCIRRNDSVLNNSQIVIPANAGIQINIKEIFEILSKNWGFKVCDCYEICLTYYGNGGSYNAKDCRILIRYKDELKEPYFYTIFHEAVHIGIDEVVVQKYKLSQAEKEIIVDAVCKKYLPSDYRVQQFENMEGLYEFLDKNRDLIEKDLVGLIEKYCFSSRKGDAK